MGIVLELIVFAWLTWAEKRYGWGHRSSSSSSSSSSCCQGGAATKTATRVAGTRASRAKTLFTSSILLRTFVFLLAAVVFTDLMSGLLHICLDNPLFNTWPVIGDAAVGFQHHHHDPGGVTRGPLWKFLREHHVGVLLVLIPGLVPATAATGASREACRGLRLFLAAFAVLSSLMMWSHRWSHTRPTEVPRAVAALQRAGILMDARHHSLHHVAYEINFSIFTGWVNPALNLLVKHVLPASSRLWIGALVGTAVAPSVFVHRGAGPAAAAGLGSLCSRMHRLRRRNNKTAQQSSYVFKTA